MLKQQDIDFLLDLCLCSNKAMNIFQYTSDLRNILKEYVGQDSNFFIYSNGSWFDEYKKSIPYNQLFDYSAYSDQIQIFENQKLAFFIESLMSKIVICFSSTYIPERIVNNIKFSFVIIRNTLEKISRNNLADNFKHQIQHLKEKLHQTQLDRKNAIEEVYQIAIGLKNPLTAIKGYAEIIKASIPTTNEVLRSIHYYSDLVLSNTANIVNKINQTLNIDELPYKEANSGDLTEKIYKYENLTAIIADSWQDNSTLLKILLSTSGINCLSAATSEEIINLTRNHNPDLIFIDEKIDHNTGIQTVLRLREMNFKNIAIVMTSVFKKNQYNLYLQSGFNEVLTKPLDKNILSSMIEKYFSSQNTYANKNESEIALAEKIAHNKVNSNPESIVASNIFLKNIDFNINALLKAHTDNDLLTIKKIVNIIRRTSGSIGLIDMSSYADKVYKSIENRDDRAVKYHLQLLLDEMKNVLVKQSLKQTS